MDAIKKKMQGMKLEKDNAMDRALLCEQQARDANARAEKAEEEARALQKKSRPLKMNSIKLRRLLCRSMPNLKRKTKRYKTLNPK
uniref:Tropomyosin n=1 Tax=Apis cerana TaxID=7461 RepID=V9IA69_APICE